MSTSGDVQYIGRYHDTCGGQGGKNLLISIENPERTIFLLPLSL